MNTATLSKSASSAEIIAKFTAFFESTAHEVTTPCEEFSVIQLGPFAPHHDGITDITLVYLEEGGENPLHKHARSSATFRFLSGSGHVLLGDKPERIPYERGTIIEVPKEVLHGFDVRQAGVMLSVQTGGSILGEARNPDIEYVDPRCFTDKGSLT